MWISKPEFRACYFRVSVTNTISIIASHYSLIDVSNLLKQRLIKQIDQYQLIYVSTLITGFSTLAKLNKQEQIKRLKEHLANLKAGASISKRDMKSLLTDEQMQQYEDQWQRAQDYKQFIVDGRSELESYTKKLRTADIIWARYENTSAANRKAETEYKALSAYESALEHLEELLGANPAVQLYLDRNVSFVAGQEPGLSAHEVPRYKLSKSHYANTEVFQTKQDIKMTVIEAAIQNLLLTKKKPQAIQKPAGAAQTLAKFRKFRKGS